MPHGKVKVTYKGFKEFLEKNLGTAFRVSNPYECAMCEYLKTQGVHDPVVVDSSSSWYSYDDKTAKFVDRIYLEQRQTPILTGKDCLEILG